MEIENYPPGTPCWIDLQTTDPAAAKDFYGQLFGWAFDEAAIGPRANYSAARLRNLSVAAIYGQGSQKANGAPPHWNTYITVADADASAKRAVALGGSVLAKPGDIFSEGRMAVIQDPTGAVFSLWQPKDGVGARLVNEPNTWCWNELYTSNLDASGKFYSELFGWHSKVVQSTEPAIKMLSFSLAGRDVASMMQIQKEWGDVPPNWAVYFAVENCREAVEKAKSLGAVVYLEPREIPGGGAFAGFQDPQGAHLLVMEMGQAMPT
jgi:predicted enzyme related to lactoylglutathione lyase